MVGSAYINEGHSTPARSLERGHDDAFLDQASASQPAQVHATETTISSRLVRAVQKARRRRDAILGTDMFSDPAWDILLELYALHLEQCRVSLSGMSDAAQIPISTGFRWTTKFKGDGLVIQSEDPNDARRCWVELSPDGIERMRRYFELLPFGSMAG